MGGLRKRERQEAERVSPYPGVSVRLKRPTRVAVLVHCVYEVKVPMEVVPLRVAHEEGMGTVSESGRRIRRSRTKRAGGGLKDLSKVRRTHRRIFEKVNRGRVEDWMFYRVKPKVY